MFNKKKIRKKENVFSKISKYLKKERRLSYKKTLIDHYKILAISISILSIPFGLWMEFNSPGDFFGQELLISFASIIFYLIIQTPNNLFISLLLKNIKNTAVRRSLFLLSSNIVVFIFIAIFSALIAAAATEFFESLIPKIIYQIFPFLYN